MKHVRRAIRADYEALFDRETGEARGGAAYRTRTIKSGRWLEAETFPAVADGRMREAVRTAAGSARHREAVQRVNERRRIKRIVRLMQQNFGQGGLSLTLTYPAQERQPDIERARKDMRNYLAAVRRWRERNGLEELRYIYVIQGSEDGSEHVHHHLIMSSMDRDEAERIWRERHGGRTNCDRLQPNRLGLRELGAYIGKHKDVRGADGQSRRQTRWACSRNLEKPIETESLSRISRRRAERAAQALKTDPKEAKAIYEQIYPGYELVDLEVRYSDVVPGPYLYAFMQRKEEKSTKNARPVEGRAGKAV